MHRKKSPSKKLGRVGARTVRRRARTYAKDPEKLVELLGNATNKAASNRGKLDEGWDSLMLLLGILKAYVGGGYRKVPWTTLLGAAGAILYFVSPLDLIPDFIAALGFVDDVAVLAWTLTSIKADLDDFANWERQQSDKPA